jgi:hypothetical protein
VRALLDRFESAYENEDQPPMLESLLTPQVERWTTEGLLYCGRDSVLEKYHQNFEQPVDSYKLAEEKITLGSDQRSATATARWTIDRDGQPPELGGVRFVATDDHGRWRLAEIDTRKPGQTTNARLDEQAFAALTATLLLPPEPPVAEGEVRELLDRYANAYQNENEPPTLGSILANSVVRRTSDDCTHLGHKAVLASYSSTFASEEPVDSYTLTNREITKITSGTKVTARWTIKRVHEGPQHGQIRFVVVRDDDTPRLAVIDAGGDSQ